MQESFWWWQCSDRYIISLSPHLHTPFPLSSPSLISLMVSVDVKHHVYLTDTPHKCSQKILEITWKWQIQRVNITTNTTNTTNVKYCTSFLVPKTPCLLIYKTLPPIPQPTHPLQSLPLLTFDPWALNSEKNPGTGFLQTDSPRTILIWRWGERHTNTHWATKRERERVVRWLGEVGVVGWERLTARSRSVALTSKTPSPTVQVSGILRE